MKKALLCCTLLCLSVMAFANASSAQDTENKSASPATASDEKTKDERYADFLHRFGQQGPAKIALRDQATLDLPEGFAFIPEEPAKKFMSQIGNAVGENFAGLIFPVKYDVWFISVEYIPAGYVNDEDAKSWNSDTLLDTIRHNTEEANKQREEEGVPALEIVGWVEKPHYDEATHKLIWSVAARDAHNTDNTKNIINYRTLLLGREGYISMIMVTDLSLIEAQKPIANLLLSKLNFDDGKHYADFNAATDHVAEYGLAALIAGVAAKKLGLLAVIGIFIAKFAKIIIIAAVALLASVRKKFSRSQSPAARDNLSSIAPPNDTDPHQ